MGERPLLAVGCALTCLLAPVLAQGPVYRERWGYLYLERLRAEVRTALAGRDGATTAKVADLLAAPAAGLPFAAPTKALASLRGVDADPAFELRTLVSAYLLPEVSDPEAKNEVCRSLNVTLFLPFPVTCAGTLSFAVEVRDRSGSVRFATTVVRDTRLDDLRSARPVASVPCGELADGTYDLVVRTRIDGAEPRAQDPVLRLPFHVLRGYQDRAETALGRARDLGPQLPPLPRALLQGFAAEVQRAYTGEAFDVVSEAVADLQRLEAVLANQALDRPLLAGLSGVLPAALPGSTAGLQCALRIAEGWLPDAPKPLPLVVFAGGAPAYDLQASRPSAPSTRGPRWLASELAAFGKRRPWHVACLESPGAGRDFAAELPKVLRALRDLLGTGEQPVVLVCEREAAAIVGLQFAAMDLPVQGLVLLGAGGMPTAALDRLGPLPVRVGFLAGYTSGESLRRSLDYATSGAAAGRAPLDFAVLPVPVEAPPWPFGVSAYAAAIEAFVAGLVRNAAK